jgi:hypothetical protein
MLDPSYIQDVLAIARLTARYNALADDGAPADYAALFTEDGEYTVVGHRTYRGRAELTGLIETSRAAAADRRVHITFDPIVTIDGDRAQQRVRVITGTRAVDGSMNKLINTGYFVDELHRFDAGWRFARRRAEIDLDMQTNLRRLGLAAITRDAG